MHKIYSVFFENRSILDVLVEYSDEGYDFKKYPLEVFLRWNPEVLLNLYESIPKFKIDELFELIKNIKGFEGTHYDYYSVLANKDRDAWIPLFEESLKNLSEFIGGTFEKFKNNLMI